MKRFFCFLSLWWIPGLLQAEEAILQLRVVNLEGQAAQVRIGIAGVGPYQLTLADGSARLPLPPQIQPGQDVTLKVLGDDWILFSPWDARVRIPPFEEKADNVALVVVGRRHQKELLDSGDVLHAMTRRILSAIDALEQRHGEITSTMRRSVLKEQADAFGLSPEEVDRALRAWRKAPISSADKALANQYLEQYPLQIFQDGSVSITDSTLRDPIIVTNPQSSPITIEQARVELELRGRLDDLGLGTQVHLSVGSSPPEAINDFTCSWSLTPRETVTFLSPRDGPCELGVLFPMLPLEGRGQRIPISLGVQILQTGTVVEELEREAVFHNEVLADTVLGDEPLGPDNTVEVSVVDIQDQQVLPEPYQCAWDFLNHPLVLTSSTPNRCQGTLSLKEEAGWSQEERLVYQATISGGAPAIFAAYVRVQDTGQSVGRVQTAVRYQAAEPDPRRFYENISRMLQSGSLQTLQSSSVKATFEPNLQYRKDRWILTLDRTKLRSLTDEMQGRFDDGEWFPVQAVSRITVPRGSEKVAFRTVSEDPKGPFEFDLEQVALASILEAIRNEDRILWCQRTVCRLEHVHLLPAIRSISWGLDEDALDSVLEVAPAAQSLMEITGSFGKLNLPKPLCGKSLYYRLSLVDGTQTTVRGARLSRERYEDHDCPPAGSDFTDPRRLRKAAASAPDVFVVYSDGWGEAELQLHTFSTPAIQEIRYSHVPGTQGIKAKDGRDGSFTIPAPLKGRLVELEFEFVTADPAGPFTYTVDLKGLRAMQALHRFESRRYLRCYRLDYSDYRRHQPPDLPEKSTRCVPNTHSGDRRGWLAISRIEIGTTPDALDRSVQAASADRLTASCPNQPDGCRFSFVLPYETQEVFARVQFWHGGWGDIRRFAVGH